MVCPCYSGNNLVFPMATKSRSDGQTAISVSMSADLLTAIDSRAEALGLSRSQYLAQLARTDLIHRGDLVLKDSVSYKKDKGRA